MKDIKKVFSAEDVAKLKAGDWVNIDGQEAMHRNERGDGVDYLIPNKNRTVTIINLRGYHLSKGRIIPIWYSEKTIDLNEKYRDQN